MYYTRFRFTSDETSNECCINYIWLLYSSQLPEQDSIRIDALGGNLAEKGRLHGRANSNLGAKCLRRLVIQNPLNGLRVVGNNELIALDEVNFKNPN
jgi:hypothetical protein